MNLTGKILLILNLIAAIVFMVFATGSRSARQEAHRAELRYQLLINGLPLETPESDVGTDNEPFDFRINPTTTIDRIDKKTLEGLFQGANGGELGGGVVRSQNEELKRLQKKVADTGDPLNYLMNLSQGGDERTAIQAARRLKELLSKPGADPVEVVYNLNLLPGFAPKPQQVALLQILALVGREQLLPGQAVDGVVIIPDEPNPLPIISIGPMLANYLDTQGIADPELDALRDDLKKLGLKKFVEDKAKPQQLAQKLLAAAQAVATTESEKTALEQLVALLVPGAMTELQQKQSTLDEIAKLLVAAYFERAGRKISKDFPEKLKRQEIGHVLLHINPVDDSPESIAWRKRVMAVIGKKSYSIAARDQVDRFKPMRVRMEMLITEEKAAFEAERQAIIQRIRYLSEQNVRLWKDIREREGALAASEEVLRAAQNSKETVQKELDDRRADVAKLTAELAAREKEIFDLFVRISLAQDRNKQLEIDLKKKEQEVLAQGSKNN